MLRRLFAVYFLLTAAIFSGCQNDSTDPVLDQVCSVDKPCPIGYDCNLVTGKCELAGDDGSTVLPDDNNLPDDGTLSDSDNFIPKDDVKCDCFGTEYAVPAKFGNIQGWCKADEDSDGIPNCIEVANGVEVDTDEDSTADYKDTDSDGDGISDSRECSNLPCKDTDSDGITDYRDNDSDDDGLTDDVECFSDPCVDSDSDGDPDYLDTDSDNDGVPDVRETAKDTDKDGMPNFLDDDSDGDGIADSVECPSIPCVDSDKDGVPDFVDTDSDGDGLPDPQEVDCTTLGIHSRTQADTDGDGYSDLAEILIGSDPCNAAEGVKDKGVKFYFELPYQGEQKEDTLTFAPTVKKADIFFNVDTTGSMGGEISTLKSSLSNNIIPGVRARISDSAFGVAWFNDPQHGISNVPVTDIGTAQNSVNNLYAGVPGDGGDCDEQGYASLTNVASNGGWRDKTIPIVMHISDAPSKADRNTAINALNAKGIKAIGIFASDGCSGATASSQLTDLSNSTGAVVPECAGAGRTVLKYDVNGNGSGLNDAVINGIDALVKYSIFSLYVVPVDDGDTGTIDTACFLKKVEALEYIPVDACAASIVATPAAFNGSAYNNGFNNFSTGTSSATNPGNKLNFKVVAQNDTCYESSAVAKLFKAFINVVDNGTGSILDTQEVTIIVPGKVSGSDW